MGEVDSAAIDADEEPLLLSTSSPESCSYYFHVEKKKKSVFSVLGKWVLKISMWFVFISWVLLMFMFPIEWFHLDYEYWIAAGAGTVFGIEGRAILVYSCPIVIVAILAIIYKAIIDSEEGEEEQLQLQKKRSEKPSYRLWTFPVVVDGPLGVVSAAEAIGIILFIVYLIWAFVEFNIRNFKEASGSENPLFYLSYVSGICFAEIGSTIISFLFLPIARGSALLRLIKVPFEHATKYHIWIGNLTMALFTLHGISMVVAFAAKGNLTEILTWDESGGANFPGVIALFIGLLMCITSIYPIRNKYFEAFFYTHQLYIAFMIFFALHVGDFFFGKVAGGLFIFILDRFLRFVQSRSITDIVSTKYLPCGVVELTLSKPANLRCNALGFIFLQIRELSWLQWHPFSISSSPLDGKSHLSVMIKVQGKWTTKLKEKISHIVRGNVGSRREQHYELTASVEGPYGHELPYYISYKNLVLVAGGIGISPFLAILSDILYRTREGTPCLPKNVLLVWAIKKSDELSLISEFSMESICPFFSDQLNLQTRIYVTQESEPPLEEGHNNVNNGVDSIVYTNVSNGNKISNLVGTGNSKWLAIYSVASATGFVVIKVLLNIYYINAYDVRAWWYKGVLLAACMVAGVAIFGGPVVGLWHLWETKIVASELESRETVGQEEDTLCIDKGDLLAKAKIQYGSRPNIQETFESINEEWGYVDVGVIVCGPSSLESSVARECRTLNVRRSSHEPIFHFHSHSFSL